MVALRLLIAFFVGMLACSLAAAQPGGSDKRFYIDITPKAGSVEETFIFSIVIENMEPSGPPFLIGGDDFKAQLLGQRVSPTLTNRGLTYQIAYNYRLTTSKTGVLETPGVEIEIDGKKQVAAPLKVRVTKASPATALPKDQQVFLRQTLDKQQAYVGEQLQHSLSLYAALPVYEPTFSDATFDGFWKESLGEPFRTRAYVGMSSYDVIRVNKALYPLRSGTITISPRTLSAKVQVRRRSRGIPFGAIDPMDPDFDAIFGTFSLKPADYTSNPISIAVLDLPPRPPSFNDWGKSTIVGATSINVDYDKSELRTGESRTITLKVISQGNLSPLSQAPLSSSDDYRIYHEEPVTAKRMAGSILEMHKLFRFSVVALKPGKLELPQLALDYFNPELARYESAVFAPITLEVVGEDLRSNRSIQENIPSGVQTPSSEPGAPPLRFEDSHALASFIENTSRSLIAAALLVMAGLTYIGMALYRRRAAKLPEKRAWEAFEMSSDLPVLAEKSSQLLSLKLQQNQEASLRLAVDKRISDPLNRQTIHALIDDLEQIALAPSGTAASGFDIHTLKARVREVVGRL